MIPDLDLLIAATALQHDLTLLTNKRRHFDRISGLRTESMWAEANQSKQHCAQEAAASIWRCGCACSDSNRRWNCSQSASASLLRGCSGAGK